MPTKSIFRQPGAKHFQLVHRSQRDPLINDPDASQHVLKEVVRGNDRKGKTRAELESALDPKDIAHDARLNVGEAALYGVYFDDVEYDYMQHLRSVGTEEEGVESFLIEAPSMRQIKSKAKGKGQDDILFNDLPPEALPSRHEMPHQFESQQAIPDSISGFQPDMDPHLRQTLEALEDDAFVDDSLEDDFFGNLVAGGERGEEEVNYEFKEDGEPSDTERDQDGDEEAGGWEERFAKFQKEQKRAPPSDCDEELDSEGGDTVGNLPKLRVVGGKQRRKGSSVASGYSMSSSSMYRTEALLTLDERFDQLMSNEYGSDGDKVEDEASPDLSDCDEAPELITSREDFAAMVDDFVENYEQLGRKLKPVLPGDSAVDKLDTLRRAIGQGGAVRISVVENDSDEEDDEKLFASYHANEKESRWDCETILTSYTNLENHPKIIRARTSKPVPKIKLDHRTGLPSADTNALEERHKSNPSAEDKEILQVPKQTVTRPRDESKEDKKARKQAVKAERQTKRVEKKQTRERYNAELKHQSQALSQKTEDSRTRKL